MRMKFLAGGLLALLAFLSLAPAAMAETRTLKLYFVHTRERAEITYKRNGRYVQDGLNQVNRFLRDWRRNEPTKMDPRLLDALWEVYKSVGARDHIHVISAYRSPATNAMLRSRSRGVANKSQHMLGKAIDFYIPGVRLSAIRRAGLALGAGGVGFYPKSGSPFVHLDVGSVRHWPRMSRPELMAMFPDGKTLHVPSDGKPLPGYQQALAAHKKRQQNGGGPVVASASASSGGKRGGFLAALFNGGSEREEDEADTATPARAPARAAVPAAAPQKDEAPQEAPADTPAVILASLPDDKVPLPFFAPRPEPVQLAAAPVETEEEEDLAFGIPIPVARPDDAPGIVLARAPEDAPDAIAALLRDGNAGFDEAKRILAGTASQEMTALPAELAFVPAPRPEPELVVASLPATDPLTRTTRERVQTARVAPADAADDVVRTTGKAPKPSARDARPDPRPLVIPLPSRLPSHVLDSERMVDRAVAARKPTFRFTQEHVAPREVYTAGFEPVAREPVAERFSGGSAVVFLSVAKFR